MAEEAGSGELLSTCNSLFRGNLQVIVGELIDNSRPLIAETLGQV